MGQHVFKEARQETTAIDDQTSNTVDVDETNILWEIITNGPRGSYPSGVWLGGREGNVVFGAGPKRGVCIACSDQSVVVGFNDEDKGQKGGNCQKAVLNMVGYLFQSEG